MLNALLFKYPINIIALLFIIVLVLFLDRYYKRYRLTKILSSIKMAIILSIAAIAIMVIDGTFALKLYNSIPFALILIFIIVNLLFVVSRRKFPRSIKECLFLLTHLGLLLTLIGGVFGYPDKTKYKMIVGYNEMTNRAYSMNASTVSLDFSAKLEAFEVDYWDKDSVNPKEFISEVTFNIGEIDNTYFIKVNSPIEYRGYKIYQDGYDSKHEIPRYTILLLVKDNWLPITYSGIIMMLLGAVLLVCWKDKKII